MRIFGKIVLISLLLFPLFINAQIRGPRRISGGFSTLGKNKFYKEVIFGIGAANFLGEVGGANRIGTDFWVRDLDFVATRPSAQLSYRLKFENHWAIRGGLYYQMLTGSDKYTLEMYRNNRNLTFRSNIYELSGQIEYFFTEEKPVKRYKIKGTKGYRNIDIQCYAFVGIGGIFFNPKAKYNGSWVALKPLGTEGQGLPGGPKQYSRFTVVIPGGIGFKQNINKEWNVGVEFGIRKTYSDYIDDASNTYYDNNILAEKRGATAAALADPKLHNLPTAVDPDHYYDNPADPLHYGHYSQGGAGQQRGDVKDKDAYMFVNIIAGYKLSYRHSGHKRKQRAHF